MFPMGGRFSSNLPSIGVRMTPPFSDDLLGDFRLGDPGEITAGLREEVYVVPWPAY